MVLVLAPAPAEAQGSVAGDREALVALYDATGGDNWNVNTNWTSGMPLGTWVAVTTNSDGRVTSLSLAPNLLTGSIPPELGNLSELTALDLGSNLLTGPIPPELGNLSKLTTLNLGANMLTGSIPSALGNLSSLATLWLENNQLRGPIPPELGNLGDTLTNLKLFGNDNNLIGCVPYLLRNVATNDFGNLGLPICSQPRATLVLTPSSIAENGGTATVTATLDGVTMTDVLLTVSAEPVAPAVAGDFTLSADTVLTIAAGSTTSTGTVTITAVDNDVASPSKRVTVSAVLPGNFMGMVTAPQDVTLTIENDEAPPTATLVLNPSTIAEDGGMTTVTATLDGAPETDVTLTVTAAPVAPTVAGDFTLDGSTLTIAAGSTTSTGDVTITAVDNDAFSPPKSVTVSAVLPDGLMVTAPQPVTLTITDDEGIGQRDMELILAGAARSMASVAVDVLSGRFDASPASGNSQMTLAGYALRLTPQGAQKTAAWRRMPIHGESAWRDDRQQAAKALSAHDLLTRSSFVLALDEGEGGEGASGLTLWGRGSVSGFSSSPETGFEMEGSFRSGWLGLDYRVNPSLLVGLTLTHGTGTVDHERTGGIDAETDITLTSVAPYAHIEAGPGLELWGLLGAGRGDMEVTVAGTDAAQKTDLSSFMGAVGGRRALTSLGGIDLAARADAFASTLRSEGTATLPGARGKAQRVRLLLEGRGSTGGGMVPRFTLGGHWDGGTADTGVGLEVGGGLAWTRTGTGLAVDLQGRYLLAHTSDGYEDWGASLDVRFDPGGDGQGLMLALSPVLGDAASGAERLHGDADLAGLAANDNRTGRLEAELAWGVAGFGGAGTVTPYGGLTLDGTDAARYRLGSRVALGSSLDLAVEGHRTEQDGAPASHGLSARLGLRW